MAPEGSCIVVNNTKQKKVEQEACACDNMICNLNFVFILSSLQSSSGVCVSIYGLAYSLYSPRGEERKEGAIELGFKFN